LAKNSWRSVNIMPKNTKGLSLYAISLFIVH